MVIEKFNKENYGDFSDYELTIDGVWHNSVVPCWYDGPLDFYIPYHDIYIRSFDSDRNLWAMFKGIGEVTLMSYDDLFMNHKIWTPLIMTDSWNELNSIK